jgi:transcriptional regulator with XRE-family HTH domain
LPGKKWV